MKGFGGFNPRGHLPDYFRYFFGDGFEIPEQEREGLGSGIIISRDGYILTNNHVVAGADEISIRLSDRRVLDAKLIGGDELSDLALLKVESDGLPVVDLGNSEKLKVGEWVLAIGSPFGFDHSVTAGIVSAKGRNLSSDNYVPFIRLVTGKDDRVYQCLSCKSKHKQHVNGKVTFKYLEELYNIKNAGS